VRFDGTTGAFIDNFVASGSGGLAHGQYLVFGPDGNLYVSSENAQGAATVSGEILRYNGKTGAFLGTYVPSGSGGLDIPFGMTFGIDGNLYVASSRGQSILRYQGPSGNNPGAFIDTFVPPGSGGLLNPGGLIFGPDGKGDGRQDLYVSSSAFWIGGVSPANSSVIRYDGTTGAFVDTFVSAGSGGLTLPAGLTFTETDPTTLNYDGTTTKAIAGAAVSTPSVSASEAVSAVKPAPLAYSLLNAGRALQAAPLPESATPLAPSPNPNGVLPTSAGSSFTHGKATDAVFAEFHTPASDDDAWLSAAMATGSVDGI
jgi:hypothetical protein